MCACRPLHSSLAEIAARIQAARSLSLFLDFDGTLTPWTPEPAEPFLDDAVRAALALLCGKQRTLIAVLGARPAADLQARIRVAGLIYGGNHGLEIRGPNGGYTDRTAAAARGPLERLSRRLESRLSHIAGVRVEYRGLTTAVHCRNVPSADAAQVARVVRVTIGPVGRLFRVRDSAQALEILPKTSWTKGAAAKWINKRWGGEKPLSICFGGDLYDEDVFRSLSDGVTVKVGNPAETKAAYFALGPPAVHEFLAWLARGCPAEAGRAGAPEGRSTSVTDPP